MNIPVISDDSKDANRDPIAGAPGAHPVGAGLGAAGGGAETPLEPRSGGSRGSAGVGDCARNSDRMIPS